jgi:hypothetical protein
MQSVKSCAAARFLRRLAVALAVLTLAAATLSAQATADPPQKPTPAKVEKQILLFPESVVLEQWPHTLKLVNAPQDLKLLNPGQCIRVGIIATGDGRDAYLEKTQLSFRVEFAGHTDSHPLAPLAATKQIKPEGGDFVTAVLASANIENPLLTMASMGASADNWCVPDGAQDGTAIINAEVESPGGHQKLDRAKILIESFETGSKRSFKNENEFDDFTMSYHYQPNPARLFPALQSFAGETQARSQAGVLESMAASFGSALKADPVAAKDFMARISAQTGFTRAFGLLALLNGGYDIDPALKAMNEEDRQMFANHPVLPDPFELKPDDQNPTRLDMLWGIFTSTGELAPMQKIASALAWRSDYDTFDKMRKSGTQIKELTPSIWRALTYGAAGWSMGSFQRTDPLAADYIEFMIASPDTPPEIKSELKGLSTNPAFRQANEK